VKELRRANYTRMGRNVEVDLQQNHCIGSAKGCCPPGQSLLAPCWQSLPRHLTAFCLSGQARNHQLLLQNRELLTQMSELVAQVKQLEVKIVTAQKSGTVIPGTSDNPLWILDKLCLWSFVRILHRPLVSTPFDQHCTLQFKCRNAVRFAIIVIFDNCLALSI